MAAPQRCIALIDMDCFYCACERRLDPSLVGVPMAVLQYNPFQGDGSSDPARIVVEIGDEPGLVLEVSPLLDAVRIVDDQG